MNTPVAFRKMALEVAAVVKNAGHLNRAIVPAAVQQKMARLFHLCAAHSIPARFQVICPRTPDQEFGPLFRSGTRGIFSNVL